MRKLPIVAQQLRKWLRKVITTVALASHSRKLVALTVATPKQRYIVVGI